MTFCLPFDHVVQIHHEIGNVGGLRDRESLEGTLARPMASFAGVDVFPTVAAKAAALLHGLATTQPFFDGNKRTAWTCCVTFLDQNGAPIRDDIPEDDATNFVMEVAVGKIATVEEIALLLIDWME